MMKERVVRGLLGRGWGRAFLTELRGFRGNEATGNCRTGKCYYPVPQAGIIERTYTLSNEISVLITNLARTFLYSIGGSFIVTMFKILVLL